VNPLTASVLGLTLGSVEYQSEDMEYGASKDDQRRKERSNYFSEF
jgi:hypothetical protein